MKNNSNQELSSDNLSLEQLSDSPNFQGDQQNCIQIPIQFQRKCTSVFSQYNNITNNELDAVIIEKIILHTHHQPKLPDIQKPQLNFSNIQPKQQDEYQYKKKQRKKDPRSIPKTNNKKKYQCRQQQFSINKNFQQKKQHHFQGCLQTKQYTTGNLNEQCCYYIPFCFQKSHEKWLIQTIRQLDSSFLTSIKHIQERFLTNFNLSINDLSKSRLNKFMRRIGITYKKIPFKPLQALKKISDTKIFEYCKQWAFFIECKQHSNIKQKPNQIKNYSNLNTNAQNEEIGLLKFKIITYDMFHKLCLIMSEMDNSLEYITSS